MKKKFVYFIAGLVVLFQASCALASNVTYPVKLAIKKYKMGNYTGCIQDCQNITEISPTNAIAYYYLAMSYAQAGRKKEAIAAYSKALSLSKDTKLSEYATTGKRCLETPDKCVLDTKPNKPNPESETELDKLINKPFTDGLSDSVRKDFEQKHLDSIKNDINNNKDINDYELRKINDASEQISPTDSNEKISKKPTNDEIVAALKVLNSAGVSYPQLQTPLKTDNAYSDQVADYQTPQMAQLDMLMNENDANNGNNTLLNMLPFMLAQNKNGTGNYSPQMIQAAIMNSMMTNLNFDLNKSEDKY